MTNRQIGEVYSSKHTEYSESTQYCYYNGVHDLALFWATELSAPTDSPVSHASLQVTLVNADSDIIVAKRMLSISPVMTQALRHTLEEQLQTPLTRAEYETQVTQAYARNPDSDSMFKQA